MTYNGNSLWEIIRHKAHPVLRLQAGQALVDMNADWSQYEAAAVFGWSEYWSQDEYTRALMCWQVSAGKILDAMRQYDDLHKDKP